MRQLSPVALFPLGSQPRASRRPPGVPTTARPLPEPYPGVERGVPATGAPGHQTFLRPIFNRPDFSQLGVQQHFLNGFLLEGQLEQVTMGDDRKPNAQGTFQDWEH